MLPSNVSISHLIHLFCTILRDFYVLLLQVDLDHLNFVLNRLLPDDVKLYNMSCMYDPRKDIIPYNQQVFHATGAALGEEKVF